MTSSISNQFVCYTNVLVMDVTDYIGTDNVGITNDVGVTDIVGVMDDVRVTGIVEVMGIRRVTVRHMASHAFCYMGGSEIVHGPAEFLVFGAFLVIFEITVNLLRNLSCSMGGEWGYLTIPSTHRKGLPIKIDKISQGKQWNYFHKNMLMMNASKIR